MYVVIAHLIALESVEIDDESDPAFGALSTAFLLTHSREFQIAMALAFSEYFIEWYFFPQLKGNYYIYIAAFIVAACGQAIRTTAMYTGGVSFHHMVQVRFASF